VFLHGVTTAVKGPLAQAAQIKHFLAQGLAGYRSGVNAHPADRALALDNRHLFSELGGANGALLAGGAASDHDQVKLIRIHRKTLLDGWRGRIEGSPQ